MTQKQFCRTLLAGAACSLAACVGGGGGGGGIASVSPSPPLPPPAPPPSPPQPTAISIFPLVTANTDFAVLGYEVNTRGPAGAIVGDGFAISYDATSKVYTIDVPFAPPGTFTVSDTTDSRYFACPNNCSLALDIVKPSALDPVLDYVTLASYYEYDWSGGEPFGYFAFGIPTTAGNVPVIGSASYKASVLGTTLDPTYDIRGSATLQFNFAGGTLAGTLNPILLEYGANATVETVLPIYSFVNTVFGIGSTSFSGGLQTPGTNTLGSFNGIFMGPIAQEVAARWTAPYYNPRLQRWSTMLGVMAGKKQ